MVVVEKGGINAVVVGKGEIDVVAVGKEIEEVVVERKEISAVVVEKGRIREIVVETVGIKEQIVGKEKMTETQKKRIKGERVRKIRKVLKTTSLYLQVIGLYSHQNQ